MTSREPETRIYKAETVTVFRNTQTEWTSHSTDVVPLKSLPPIALNREQRRAAKFGRRVTK